MVLFACESADGICGLKWLCQLVGHPGSCMCLGETRCFAHDLRSCAWPVLRRAHRLLGSGRLLKRLPSHTGCVEVDQFGACDLRLCVSVIPVLLGEMALAAFRGVALGAGRSTRLLARPLALPATKLPPTFARLPMQASASRSYITVQKYSRDDVLSQLDECPWKVMSTNWADYLILVYSVPFWEAELEKLTSVVQPYLHEPEVGEKFKTVQEMMDVFYQCEDVRDHLNELAELATRASGFMGTGFAAEEKVENMDEHAKQASEAYDKMLEKHPEFKPKIEQTVGHGLAILRQKHKFKFGSMHRYFY
ncbi:unnamed protein product [Symbiodinium necroappetens]|uniref:DUF6827 domain-containing protein n=1 Tax=Symbiodinium necroappetens TaxID=1628268 RepID=A0A812RFK0_9DINO|nr:unnamed protein product [Symbiodinium necroappetens]